MKRAIVTVLGQDKVGIIARVSKELAASNVNILDINQTVMQEFFTMMMLVELSDMNGTLSELKTRLEGIERELALAIRINDEEIFNAMHRV